MGRHATKREMDLQILLEWIDEGARVLDLGCGRGILLDELMQRKGCYTVGVDNDLSKITSCVKRGVPAYQGDIAEMLGEFGDEAFDWVVCSRTLQELSNPGEVLREALRVGRRLAAGFVNHGYWLNRWHMLREGTRVKNEVYPDPWWSARATNPVSVNAFEDYCEAEGVAISRRVYLASDWRTPCSVLPGWRAGYAVYELSRQPEAPARPAI